MKKTGKILALTLASLMALSALTGCGSKTVDDQQQGTPAVDNTIHIIGGGSSGGGGGGGGGFSAPSYSVSVDDVKHGTVTVSPKSASKGDTVTITVTAPSGAVKRYTISVIRQPDPNYTASTDAALSALTASYGEISPAFTSDVTDYVLYVPHETEHITLSGTARDGKAVQVTGADAALDEGENVLTVTCTAEDGVTVMTYTVHVWRMPAYAGTLPQIIVPTDTVEPDQPAQEDASALSALWASLCAPFVLPFGGWTVPLYAVAAAAMVLLLLLLLAAAQWSAFLCLSPDPASIGLADAFSLSGGALAGLLALAFLLLSALLLLATTGRGARRPGYTLARLPLSPGWVVFWQGVYNTLVYLLFWGVQALVLVGIGWYYGRQGGVPNGIPVSFLSRRYRR